MDIKKILVPVDFSDTSVNALKYATELAGKMNARLEIVHVYHITAGGDTSFFVNESMIKNQQLVSEKKLKELASDIPSLENIPHAFAVEFGLTSSALLNYLDAAGIDLVVMGTKGATDILSKVVGSTTTDIINNARCPVIAIPKEARSVHWSNVAVALDKIEMDTGALKSWLSYLRQIFDCNFYVIHINETPADTNYPEQQQDVLKQLFEEIPFHFHAVASHSVERGLIDHMKEVEADVLMIFPRKRHIIIDLFTHKVTNHLCEQLHQPIFAYRETANKEKEGSRK